MIAKLHSLNSIQLLILTKLKPLNVDLEANSKSIQSTIKFIRLYYYRYVSDTIFPILYRCCYYRCCYYRYCYYIILLYYHMLLLLLLGFNLILLLPISLYAISIISWLYCMRSSSYSYRIVH